MADIKKSRKWLVSYPDPVREEVLKGCKFIREMYDVKRELTIDEKSNLISVVGRLDIGSRGIAKFFDAKPDYSATDLKEFTKNTIETHGAATCQNIGGHFNCIGCEYRGKVLSPIEIKGPDHIESEAFGFYEMRVYKGERVPTKTPAYRDLVKKFSLEHQYLTVLDSGQTYTWSEKIWSIISDLEIDAYAERYFNPRPSLSHCREFRSIFKRTNLISRAEFEPDDSTLINLENGVVDVASGELFEHDPKYYKTTMLPYKFDPNADCPVFREFLSQVTRDDEAMQSVLMEFVGYSIVNGPCFAEKALILCGEGSNGKSTFVQLIKELVGPQNYAALALSTLNNAQNRAQIEGKLVNIGEETSSTALGESDVFKTMVTGGEIDIKKVYQQPYSIRARAKMIILCNEVPKSKDRTDGLYRRMLLVPFAAKFSRDNGNIDPEIGLKLKRELPGILNLAIKHYNQLKENRWAFTKCKAVDHFLDSYKLDNDNIHQWFEECCHFNPDTDDGYVSTRVLYISYSNYCKDTGTKPASQQLLMRRLKILEPEIIYDQRSVNNKRIRVAQGITII